MVGLIATLVRYGLTTVFPFIPLGIFLLARQLFKALFSTFSPIEWLINILVDYPRRIHNFIGNIVGFLPAALQVVLYSLSIPFYVVQAALHMPLTISNFFFDILSSIISIPFIILMFLIGSAWRIFLFVTYIPRLPFTLIFSLPGMSIFPAIIHTLWGLAFKFGCIFFNSIKYILRLIWNIPARIILLPLTLLVFLVLLPVRVILLPIYLIDLVFQIAQNVANVVFHIIPGTIYDFIFNLMPGFWPVKAIINLISIPFAIPWGLFKSLIAILNIPNYFLKWVYFT